ncbi:MAG: leucine-rich repeat domain-containing protein [Candidatus Coproplasma sp.]
MKKFLSLALATVSVAACLSFVGCSGGEAVVNYTLSEDGTYYILSSVSGNKNALTEYEIPSTYSAEEGGDLLPVKVIGDSAFFECTSLSKITIPDSVTQIGNLSFALSGISEIDIPDSVESIGYSAFGMCKSLKEVVIPANVTSLGERAFVSCAALERAEVYASITDLEQFTFYNSVISMGGVVYSDSALSKVVLTDSITKICDTALQGNPITDIYYMGSEEQWDELYFYTKTTDDKGETVEEKVDKSTYLATTTVHFNYVPET